MRRCLHQFIRPDRRNLEKHGYIGECYDCKNDEEENKKCKKYTPINIDVVEVDPE